MGEADKFLREFVRYTGDGMPGEPVGAPLPIGDPRSGVYTPTKQDLRDWGLSITDEAREIVATIEEVANIAENAFEKRQSFTITSPGGQNVFVLDDNPASKLLCEVYLDGVLVEDSLFSLSGRSITLVNKVYPPAKLIVRYRVPFNVGVVASAAMVQTGAGRTLADELFDLPLLPEHCGAVGNGIADDTAAIQTWLDTPHSRHGSSLGKMYRITSPVYYPSDRNIHMQGAIIRRDFAGQFAFENATGRSNGSDENVTLDGMHFIDGGTSASRGGFLLASGVNNFTLKSYRVNGSSPNAPGGNLGAWGAFISGKVVNIAGPINIDTSACGLFGDGLHFGYVENMSIAGGYVIQAGDDALAMYVPNVEYDFIHEDKPSRGITVNGGYVSSSHANGIRVGAGVGPASVWKDLAYADVVFGPCAASCIKFEDVRSGALITDQHDNVTFDAMNFGEQDNIRLVAINGNGDIAHAANYLQHNIGYVKVSGRGKQTNSSGQISRIGGADFVEIGGDLSAESVARSAADIEFRQISELLLDALRLRPITSGVSVQLVYCEETTVRDLDYVGDDGAIAFQVQLNPNTSHNIFVTGGRIKGVEKGFTTSGTGLLGGFVLDRTDLITTVSDVNAGIAAATRYIFNKIA